MYKKPDIDSREIDMREEFNSLRDRMGLNVLLVRRNNKTRCKCYDVLHEDGNSKCRICGGSGKLNLIEQVKTVYENTSMGNPSGKLKMTELGLSTANTMSLYFNFKVAPKVQDRVFIVGYDQNGLPIDIKTSLTIVAVDPIRGESGRLELYKAFAKYSPEKLKQDQKRLDAIPPISKSKIIKGVRYSWPLDLE